MSVQVLKNQRVWFGPYDLSTRISSLGLEYGAELQDATTFGDTTRVRLGGLKTVTAQHEGYWEGDPTDQALFDDIALADVPMSFGAGGMAEGDVAYTFKSILGQYTTGGGIGEMHGFSVAADATGELVRGTLMHNAARTASFNGTVQSLGAVAAGQKLYAALHVLAASGTTPTLDVVLESDIAGFASPVSRITFAQKAASGFEWAAPVVGPITDTEWRLAVTIGGTSPSFSFVVVAGIQ